MPIKSIIVDAKRGDGKSENGGKLTKSIATERPDEAKGGFVQLHFHSQGVTLSTFEKRQRTAAVQDAIA